MRPRQREAVTSRSRPSRRSRRSRCRIRSRRSSTLRRRPIRSSCRSCRRARSCFRCCRSGRSRGRSRSWTRRGRRGSCPSSPRCPRRSRSTIRPCPRRPPCRPFPRRRSRCNPRSCGSCRSRGRSSRRAGACWRDPWDPSSWRRWWPTWRGSWTGPRRRGLRPGLRSAESVRCGERRGEGGRPVSAVHGTSWNCSCEWVGAIASAAVLPAGWAHRRMPASRSVGPGLRAVRRDA